MGEKKRFLKDGETISSPTVYTEALLTTLVINSMKKWDVAIFDVPGDYLYAEIP